MKRKPKVLKLPDIPELVVEERSVPPRNRRLKDPALVIEAEPLKVRKPRRGGPVSGRG